LYGIKPFSGGDVTDRELVEAAQRGDASAFTALARRHADRVYALTNRILLDPTAAEDAAQQAFVRAWQGLPRLRDVDRFETWLRRLVVRACFDQADADRRWRVHLRLLPAPDSQSDSTGAIAARDELERALARLKPAQRAVLTLRYYLDLPIAEIAAALEISDGTVSSRLHYALDELRSILQADGRIDATEGRTA
jgi:RNA polymerase sigma-70 factor (ECF subfamily)